MNWQNYIVIDSKILSGKPTIAGTRISVELIIEKLSEGESIDQILESYPHLDKNSILASCIPEKPNELPDLRIM